MNNITEWKENVIQFLLSRKKYRICGREFGPTILDELSCQYEYIEKGIMFTIAIALSAGAISGIVTRRTWFTAAITSGLIVLGAITTMAVDYQLTRRKDKEISEEECIALLIKIEEMPKYWLWSKKENELYCEGLKYLDNYYKRGGKIMLNEKGNRIIPAVKKK